MSYYIYIAYNQSTPNVLIFVPAPFHWNDMRTSENAHTGTQSKQNILKTFDVKHTFLLHKRTLNYSFDRFIIWNYFHKIPLPTQ